ncbi:DUF3306 domain-containing protein [Marinobacter apostichopi]|uniref:DUF3306 domain-containing protein n=1 Tax=Marinobacter apostichopi TaxID=3035454 RepID=UPI00257279DA|nr:DUF3306 domain-containing protein [Marinobacter sp. LA51]
MAESRWQRWSRIKTEARHEVEPAPPLAVEPEPAPLEQELAVNEALPEHEVLKKYDLPDPDAIELGTDITGFMRKEIPELLRRKALRSLWKSNPVLAVLDGLNDYDEDFTDSAPGIKGAKTIYQVGKGFLNRTDRAMEKPDEQVEDRITDQAKEENPRESREPVNEPQAEERIKPVIADAEETPIPHYRPRMRFD